MQTVKNESKNHHLNASTIHLNGYIVGEIIDN
jgi:hypothetical protein